MSEVSLKAFVESTWFKGLARGAMIIGAGAAAYTGVALASVHGRIDNVVREQASAAAIMARRGQVNDNREAVNAEFREEISRELDSLQSAVIVVRTDIATVKGILQEMHRRSAAAELLPREGP